MAIVQAAIIGSSAGVGITDLPEPGSGSFQSSISGATQNGTPFDPGSAQAYVNNSNSGLLRRKYAGTFASVPGGALDINFFNNNVEEFRTSDSYVSFGSQPSQPSSHSFEWLGYILAPSSGIFNFAIHSDDDAYMWIGDNAISGYTQANALVGVSNALAYNFNSVILTNGLWYPVRIWFSDFGGAETMQVYFGAVNITMNAMNANTISYDATTTGLNDLGYYGSAKSSDSVDEGSSVTYYINTQGYRDGSTLYWTNTGTAHANRFSDGLNSGSFMLTNNNYQLVRTLLDNHFTDGSTTISMQIHTGSTSGPVVIPYSDVTVNDTSPSAPAPGSALFDGASGYLTVGSGPFNITPTSNNFNAFVHSPPAPDVNGSLFYFNYANTPIQAGWTFTAGGQLCTVVYVNILPFGPGYPDYSQCEFHPRIATGTITANSTVVMNQPQPWNFGTTWTIEWWSKANHDTTDRLYTVMSQQPGSGIFYDATTLAINNSMGDYIRTSNANSEPTPGIWTHVAVVNNSGNLAVYYNGISQSLTSYVGPSWTVSNYNLAIGERGFNGSYEINNFQYFGGNLTNIRVNNTAVYTSNFEPTVALTNIAGTVLLYAPTDQAFTTDTSSNPLAITNHGATYSSDYPMIAFDFTSPPTSGVDAFWLDLTNNVNAIIHGSWTHDANYGGGVVLSGSGYIEVQATNPSPILTISMAADFESANGNWNVIYSGGSYGQNDIFAYMPGNSSDTISVGTGANQIQNSSGLLTTGLAWWDFVYDGTSITAYKNGTQVASGTLGLTSTGFTNNLWVGLRYGSSGDYLTGTIYRLKYQQKALDQTAITSQYNSVKTTYNLP